MIEWRWWISPIQEWFDWMNLLLPQLTKVVVDFSKFES
jgi:hypothetical protein